MKVFHTLVAAVFVAVTLPAAAQKLSAAKVPATVKAAFAKNHPNTKVAWSWEDKDYEAEFTLNGQESSEIYTAAGIKTQSETEIAIAALPATVLTYLKLHYKGAKIGEAAKIVKANGEVNYEAQVKGKDLMFNDKGKLLK